MRKQTVRLTSLKTAVALLFVWFAIPVHAQTEQAGITGTVTDSQSAAVPGALVEIRHEETMLARTTRTSESGSFFIGGLAIGNYSISITHPGFDAVEWKGIRLSVAQVRTLDTTLKVSGRSDQVLVATELSEVDRVSSTVGERIDQTQLKNLPLNGRNWATLLTLIPGAVDPGTSDQRSVRFSGHGRDDNNFTLDGVDAGGISNQPQKSAIRLFIPTSAIQEFKVESALSNADTGATTGGQVILASRAGTNALHGEAFHFLRNDIFDARNPFALTKPPFRLNQFGGSLGGPITKDRTFVFVAFEGLLQRLGQTLRGFVPSASYREQVLARSPVLAPLISAYPVGTLSQSNDPSTDLFVGLSPQKSNEASGMVRLDHRLTSSTTAFLRFNLDRASSDVPLANLKDRQVTRLKPMNAVLNLTHILSYGAINETRVGFNQILSRTVNQTSLPFSLAVSGFTTLSSARTREEDDTSVSFIDNFSWTHDRHFVKVGAELRRVFTDPGSSADGTLSYTNRDSFLVNQMDSASVTASLPLKQLRKTQMFSFVQDEYKATRNLTITAGLRYQYFGVFSEKYGRAVPFDFVTCGGLCQPGSEFSSPRNNDIDPHIGVAWAPASLRGKTVVRIGAGIYHGDGQMEDQNLPASNDVARYSLSAKQIAGLAFPIDPFLATVAGTLSPRAQDRNRKDETSPQWGLSIQQELPAHFTGTVSYNGNKGTHLQTITYRNLIDPLTGVRPFPQYGQVEYRTNDSNSTFQSLEISAHRNLHSGWMLATNYMWSHSINDGSLGGGETDAVAPQNVFCRSCERSSSAQDVRHFFSANSYYELPFGTGKTFLSQPGVLSSILGGWSLSWTGTARSGRPVNVTIKRAATDVPGGYNVSQRPDLVPGVSLVPSGGRSVSHWINPDAFRAPAPGTIGDAGRNIVRGPNLIQFDAGLSKRFRLGEGSSIEFRSEVFNIFNRAQLGDPSGDATVPAQFGVIQSTVNTTPIGTGTPRQLQFMLRVSF
jgi:hypothetical protein